MNRVIITGANGAMGQVLAGLIAQSEDFETAAGIDLFPDARENPFPVYPVIDEFKGEADLIIDFSKPEALENNLRYAVAHNIRLIIATTGFNDGDKAKIAEAAKHIPLFFTANMSLGVNLQLDIVRQAASFFGAAADIEIVERHHNIKTDAPSGTAMMLAEAINEEKGNTMTYQFGRSGLDAKRKPNEIGMHAIRGGHIVGEHDVLFITDEELLEIRHRSESKQVFAAGALRAATFLMGCDKGLYSMADIVGGVKTVTNTYVQDGEAVITLQNFPGATRHIADLFEEIAKRDINLDIISQSVPRGGYIDLSFSLDARNVSDAQACIKQVAPGADYMVQSDLAKISIEGMGMENSSGVAAKLFGALAEEGVEILIITTSETRITFCIEADKKECVVAIVRKAFELQ